MDFIRLGDYNRMTVVKTVDFGVYLDGGEEGEVLLPARYVPDGCKEGDELEVFVYLDNEERLVATTQTPLAKVGDFAYLETAWVNEYGAFLNWGLMKDLFCPFREQKMKMEKGKSYIVYVHIDDESHRIVASAKIDKFLDNRPADYHQGDPVEILIAQRTDMGYKVIIDNLHSGIIYHNEIFKEINIGDRMEAYIKSVREDGKIDVTLADRADRRTMELADKILMHLMSHGRRMTLTDKSSPEAIKSAFECSKKDFKKAIGYLYKKKIISLQSDSIELT